MSDCNPTKDSCCEPCFSRWTKQNWCDDRDGGCGFSFHVQPDNAPKFCPQCARPNPMVTNHAYISA